jgi:SagB-type dehydrogenase family enzyme
MVGRRRFIKGILLLASSIIAAFSTLLILTPQRKEGLDGEVIELPKPPKISMPVEEAIQRRRSIREYRYPIDLTRFSQLLFYSLSRAGSGYGALQTALNEVEVYVAVGEGKVEGVPAGIYLYRRDEHTLKMLREGDFLQELASAAVNQPWVKEACFNVVLFSDLECSVLREGVVELPHLCAGILGEKVYLAAVGLGLGCVVIGAFYDDRVKRIFKTAKTPLYIIPVGDRI